MSRKMICLPIGGLALVSMILPLGGGAAEEITPEPDPAEGKIAATECLMPIETADPLKANSLFYFIGKGGENFRNLAFLSYLVRDKRGNLQSLQEGEWTGDRMLPAPCGQREYTYHKKFPTLADFNKEPIVIAPHQKKRSSFMFDALPLLLGGDQDKLERYLGQGSQIKGGDVRFARDMFNKYANVIRPVLRNTYLVNQFLQDLEDGLRRARKLGNYVSLQGLPPDLVQNNERVHKFNTKLDKIAQRQGMKRESWGSKWFKWSVWKKS